MPNFVCSYPGFRRSDVAVYGEQAMIEFLRKSYLAADGLWFLSVEKEHSYDEAMRLDEEVWRVLPKIQARKARELLGIKSGSLSDLALALGLRFAAEGWEHRTVERTANILRIEVLACPWIAALERSGRLALAPEICDRICTLDYSIWAAQFSPDIEFAIARMVPTGAPTCELVFTRALVEKTEPEVERKAAG